MWMSGRYEFAKPNVAKVLMSIIDWFRMSVLRMVWNTILFSNNWFIINIII